MYARRIEDLGFVSQEQRKKDRKGLYKVIPAEKLSQRELGLHLCEAGPANCTICGACAYGLEYLRRCKSMAGMTQSEFVQKYHATSADVSIAVRGMMPIGEKQGVKKKSKLYDEKKVVQNLAGVWRGRANNHIRMAQEWQAKADAAETMAEGVTSSGAGAPPSQDTSSVACGDTFPSRGRQGGEGFGATMEGRREA